MHRSVNFCDLFHGETADKADMADMADSYREWRRVSAKVRSG